ncbi:hypothetical protein ABIF96_007386 [Bradyrhizobium ottawaense]
MPRRFEDVDRAVDIGAMIRDRGLDRGNDVGQRRQMEDPVDTVEIRLDRLEIGDVGPDDFQLARTGACGQIFGATDHEIIERDDLVAVVEETIDEVTSNEAGAASNDAFHEEHP